MKSPTLKRFVSSAPGARRTSDWPIARSDYRMLVVLLSLAILVAFGVTGAAAEQKPKAKKVDGGKPKQGGPKAPAPPKSAPVTGRSYADIVAQSGPVRRRAWTPRPVVGVMGKQILAIVRGRAYVSTTGGSTWSPAGLAGLDGDEAVALGSTDGQALTCILRSGWVVESRDAGVTWTRRTELAPISEITGPRAVEVAGVGPLGAWAIVRGYSEPLPSSALMVTDANGWRLGTKIAGAAVAGWRSREHFAAIVGSTVILAGADGEDQARGATLSGASLNDIAFATSSTAWIAADSGLVIESNDGGRTWLPRPVLAGQDLDVIGSTDGGVNWVVGHAGARGNLAVNLAGKPEWKVSLQAVAPLSRPVRSSDGEFVVLDGAGVVWSARDLAGPWARRGALESPPAR